MENVDKQINGEESETKRLEEEKGRLDEGYIKFKLFWEKAEGPADTEIGDINHFRTLLHDKKLIGAYKNGIGFGNISKRTPTGFLISGTQTGEHKVLTTQQYTHVWKWDIGENQVFSRGPIKASSESMTHAVIYDKDPAYGGVIHIHDTQFWTHLLHGKTSFPKTRKSVSYGTPEMALELNRLFEEEGLADTKLVVMEGHEGGVVTFGRDLKEAYEVLTNVFLQYEATEMGGKRGKDES